MDSDRTPADYGEYKVPKKVEPVDELDSYKDRLIGDPF